MLTTIILFAIVLSFVHCRTSLKAEEEIERFPTISRAELISHELNNPFTPFFRDPKYRNKRLCRGFSTWQDAVFDNHHKLKALFDRNCSHIVGNLIISEIQPGDDIDFLSSIEEVSGYVFIHHVTKPHFVLPNLQIIRGEESIHIRGQEFALLVTETYKSRLEMMLNLEFPSLKAILMHGVGFFDNPGLCYAPFSVNWDDILEYPDLQPVILVPMKERILTHQWVVDCLARYTISFDDDIGNLQKTNSPESLEKLILRSVSQEETPTVTLNVRRRKDTIEDSSLSLLKDSVELRVNESMHNIKPVDMGKTTEIIMQMDDENLEIFVNEDSSFEDRTESRTGSSKLPANQLEYSSIESDQIKSEFSKMLTNETIGILANFSTPIYPWMKWKCHDTCPKRNGQRYCWGPDEQQCQILRKCKTRVCGGPNRCVDEGGVEECCHEECIGGCSGTRANECTACRRYSYEGNCVSACPATRIYNVHTSSWERNKNGKVALGHVCVPKCPEGFLLDNDHCVLKCSNPGTQQVHNVCVQCPPSGCPKKCFAKQLQLPSVDFLYKSLLKKMTNCTSWEGSIILKKQSFEGDYFHNLTKEEESVTFEDLTTGLGNLVEISGIVYIGTGDSAPWLLNLTFLSKLRRIGGDAPFGHASPLNIVHNQFLEYLGLSSLAFVNTQRGSVQIVSNPKLCLADTINWRTITRTPKISSTDTAVATTLVLQNRPPDECAADGFLCDASVCKISQGCWGPGPENCRSCAHWLIQGQGEKSRCVLNCSLVEGGYYPMVIAKTTESNVTLMKRLCSKCHKECGSLPGACHGPGPNHCNHGCLHVKDGNSCSEQCPMGKYPDETKICQECASVCTSYAQGLYRSQDNDASEEESDLSAVCTGPGDWVGANGCTQCIQVVASSLRDGEGQPLLKCLTPYQTCPNGTFLHLMGIQRFEGNGSAEFKIDFDSALVHVPAELQAPLSDWFISHQSQLSGVGMVRVCAPCHPECADFCSGHSPNQCTRCRNARFRGICVAECPEGTYETKANDGTRQCFPCHEQCSLNCTGPSSSDCVFCRHFKQYLDKEQASWRCVEACPEGSLMKTQLNTASMTVEFVCLYEADFSDDYHLKPSNKTIDCLFFCSSSEIISPETLARLSWLSRALLISCGLLAAFIAAYFSYLCSKMIIKGCNSKGTPILEDSGDGVHAACHRFWMRAVVVADADEEKDPHRQSKVGRTISLRSLPVKSSIMKTNDELIGLMAPEKDAMPDMATLLIIPEYQLKLGCRVGGGAFGSVYKGVWYKGPVAPSHSQKCVQSFEQLAPDKLANSEFAPVVPLIEDTNYVSTEQEYLTMDEEWESGRHELICQANSKVPKPPQSTDNVDESTTISMENFEQHLVAVKVLNDETDPSTSKALLEEARVMATVNHPCCLRLLALCMTARPQLVTSFLPLGCLLSYMHKHGGPHAIDCDVITPEVMLSWASQIASGMAYLASRGIIHRDLAARNVLVESPVQVKITDFGLAKCLDDTGGEYTANGGLMPVKWLAIECIKKRIFSSKSDVWAYGVTLWEIFTLGKRPFDKIHTRHLIHHLEKGLRLPQPLTASHQLYDLMSDCWKEDSERRPSFDELFQRISYMLLEPLTFVNFRRVRMVSKSSQGRRRLVSDPSFSGSTTSYLETTINTVTTTGNTSCTLRSNSEGSVCSGETYQGEGTLVESHNGSKRDNDSFEENRYCFIMAASSQQSKEPAQILEYIEEDPEESNALEGEYEQPKEAVRMIDPLPSSSISPESMITEEYLEPKEHVYLSSKAESDGPA